MNPMRWIYLSPHFDDAVLSCGGLIHQQTRQGLPVEIWTICAGDAPAGPLSMLALACHRDWGTSSAEETITMRRLEDQDAAAVVGADTVHFGIPDCIYRQSPTGELMYQEDVFCCPHPAEKGLDAEIAAALNSELKAEDIVVSPLALGAHVDHQLVRRAAELLERPLFYYADIPYLFQHADTLPILSKGLDEKVHPVAEENLSAWMDGIAAYKSQMVMLFNSDAEMKEAIRQEWESRHGTRLWSGPVPK
jgi:LmbE family N-acetylglucosaminyl deacetylase